MGRKTRLVFVSLLAICLFARQGVEASSTQSPRELQASPFRAARLGEPVTLVDWDIARLRVAHHDGEKLRSVFPVRGDLAIELELEPFSVTSDRTEFVLGRKDGPDERLDFDPASIAFFRGHAVGRPGSHVFLALGAQESTGYLDLGAGEPRYRLSSRGSDGEELEYGTVSVFPTHGVPELPPGVPECGVSSEPLEGTHEPVVRPGPRASLGLLGMRPGLKHLELAIETDHEFYQLFDDATAAAAYVVAMYAQISDIYARDVDTRIEVTFVRIWDDPNDLFNDVDPSPLSDFRNYWNANMGAVQRDIAQLLSGRNDYPFGGQASLSALCGSSGYSVVGYAIGFFPDPTKPSPYNYDISVSAHEIGHNAGTGHTHSSPNNLDECDDPQTTPQRGTIMSYCGQTWSGGNSNRDNYFHSVIQANMDAHIAASSCIVDDCNANNVADSIDISSSTSDDVNSNSIPDECEDCNDNSVLDDQDIAGPTSTDLNSNGIPDECEPDCNNDSVPDDKNIADGTSLDLYGNDIPDECEADCDNDGTSDYTEIQADMTLDIDRNRILDACQDCDGDGTIDHDELAGAHDIWMASGLAGSQIDEFFASNGVGFASSSGGAGALIQEGQDLLITDDGRIFVSSAADDRVAEFDLDGNYVGDFVPSGGAGLDYPTGLVVDGAGNLLVASRNTNSVLSFALADGASQGAFVSSGSGGLTQPFGITFGPNGNLFVTSETQEVLEYDGQSGVFVGTFVGGPGVSLLEPRGLTFKGDGDLLVASYGTDQVLAFEGDTGAPLGRWAISGTPTRLTQDSPWGIRVGPNGNVYVARTGEDYSSSSSTLGAHEHHHEEEHHDGLESQERIQVLHLTNAQMYEFDVRDGGMVRSHINGNDHGFLFPSGFDFVPGDGTDCNYNQIPDECDLSSGASQDLNANAVPDECEIDCNANGVRDRNEIIPFGTSLDCNANLSPDSCDIPAGVSLDCDKNGVPDECEISDELETNLGWTVGAPGDTATTGVWERVDPNGTASQPEDDHTPGSGTHCFVTGQGSVGGSNGENDVDGGATTLISPVFDLSGDTDPELRYWRWFSSSQDDEFVVDITNDGGQNWTNVETVDTSGNEADGGWFLHRVFVSDFVTPTDTVQLRFVASDTGGASLVEAAIDDLDVISSCAPCSSDLDCDDGLSCTTDSCSIGTGSCQNVLNAGSCLIGYSCYGDGQESPFDDCLACDVAAPGDWTASLPVEVEGLEVERGTLAWTAQSGTALYDIIGGDVTDLLVDTGIASASCFVSDLASAGWPDSLPDPGPDSARYYLVRAKKSCQKGGYGNATSGQPRTPVTDCP